MIFLDRKVGNKTKSYLQNHLEITFRMILQIALDN